jgi:predicted membrane protein (TIGR00267 family)
MGFGEALRLSGAGEIARRYFVLNAFDGILTMLGFVAGAHAAGAAAREVSGAALGVVVAMFVSGLSGAFLTESAEQKAKLRELEADMLRDLDDTAHGEAARASAFAIALVNGVSPALSGGAVFLPFALIPPPTGALVALGAALSVLLALGLYLARVTGEVPWKYGAKMVAVGLVTAALLLGIELIL